MRILLVRPPVPKHTIGLKHVMVCEPLELECVAAGAVGHDVRIFDMILERGLDKQLRAFRPDIVATSCYITGVNEAIKVCRAAKCYNISCFTIVGGVHASVAPEDFADPSVDCIALGDGASLMPRIIDAIAGETSLADIPNLALPSGPNCVVRTRLAAYMPQPDALPFPRRDLTAHLRHRYYYLFHQPVAIMKTTWGCWYNCGFCMTWTVTGGMAFSRSPESIVAELEQISETEVYIVDDIFLINQARLSEIAQLIRKRGIRKKFLVYGRADFISEHEEVIREWSALGMSAVIVGLEAGTDAELSDLDKRCTLAQNKRAIDVLRRQGVDIYASLITQPEYDVKDWRRLAEFIDEHKLYYVNISPLTPMPGSPIWKRYEPQITVDRAAHGLWDLTHCVLPTRLPLKQYYRQLLRLYAHTVLNMRRAGRITLRTRPPIRSLRYLRLWMGAARVFLQFVLVHRHHGPKELARARDRGPEVPGLSYRFAQMKTAGENMQPTVRDTAGGNDTLGSQESGVHRAHDPFEGFIAPDGRLPDDAYDGLLNSTAARYWFEIFSWATPLNLYTYQQPFEGKSSPYCVVGGRTCRMLSSYDYLGLIGHHDIEDAAIRAVRKYGTGTGGVRLLTGTTDLHSELEQTIARFKGTEGCITFGSGYVANIACITALLGPRDRAVLDSRVHRSIRDACRLARVPVQTFAHNDCNALEQILAQHSKAKRTLVVVEGVYSMDGDICSLPEIVALKRRYGSYLMVDEAHSIGVLGTTGRGVNEHFGLAPDTVDIWMGTLSKALATTGGYIAGSRALIAYLQHASAPFMFSAAAAPATVAAARAAIEVLEREPARVHRAAVNAGFMRRRLEAAGIDIGNSTTHVVPVIVGSDENAWRLARELFGRGIVALAVASPAVRRGSARLRLCATASQTEEFLAGALDEVISCCRHRSRLASGL
jgi:glycine C-acetyltransferase